MLKNSSLVPDAHNPKTSQNMQAAATALEFVKLKNSDQKKKPPTESMMAMVLTSLSLSLSLRICAPRARVDFNCLFLLFLLLFCAASMGSRARARTFVVAYVRGETQENPNSTDLPTYHHVFLPSCFEEPLQMDTYLPTYLPTGPSFQQRTFPLAIKEKRSAQSERKRELFLSFFFSFFSTLPLLLANGFRFFRWVKERKAKEKKRKEKQFCSESITFFSPFFCLFFFSLFFFFSILLL